MESPIKKGDRIKILYQSGWGLVHSIYEGKEVEVESIENGYVTVLLKGQKHSFNHDRVQRL